MKKKNNTTDRTRRVFFGPGLFLAVLASIAIWSLMPRQPKGPKLPPSASTTYALPPSAPDPDWLLQQKALLRLSPEQSTRMTGLVARWDRETKDLRDELAAATDAFNKDMQARQGKPASMQDMQRNAVPITDLSARLARARQAWWADAARICTPEQKANAEQAWANRMTLKKR